MSAAPAAARDAVKALSGTRRDDADRVPRRRMRRLRDRRPARLAGDDLARLPIIHRILLENVARCAGRRRRDARRHARRSGPRGRRAGRASRRSVAEPGGDRRPVRRAVRMGEASTYVRRPPFASFDAGVRIGRYETHPLLVVGDDVTPTTSPRPGGSSARAKRRTISSRAARRPKISTSSPRAAATGRRCCAARSPTALEESGRREHLARSDVRRRNGGAAAALEGRGALCRERTLGGVGRGRALRHGLVARLGGVRRRPFGRAGGARLELRAHPSLQSDLHGRAAAAPAGRRDDRRAPAPGRWIAPDLRAAIEASLEVATLEAGGLPPLILRQAARRAEGEAAVSD